MNDLDNVHRSVRRWLALVLPSPPWTVALEDSRNVLPDDDRPYAIAAPIDAAQPTFARMSVPQGDRQLSMPMSLALYPAVAETPREGRLDAFQVAQLVSDALSLGLVNDDGSNLCLPFQVPLWDYTDVPIEGPNRAGPAIPYGVIDVVDPTVRPIPDDDDPLRWSVQGTFRASWWSSGRIPSGPGTGGPATAIPPTFVPPGA